LKYYFIVLFISIFAGCSSGEIKSVAETPKIEILVKVDEKVDENLSCDTPVQKTLKEAVEIYDLVNIPQDVSYFINNFSKSIALYDIQKQYEKHYFSVWNIDKPREDLDSSKWPFASFCVGSSYGENFQLLKQQFFDDMLKSANFDSYGSVNKKAIVLKETNIRAFPTVRPLLKDPSLAGEGFPFDYLQNSTLTANKPIFISHYSKNREWAYIFSSFTSGWIKSDEFVILNKKNSDIWQKAQQVHIIVEGSPIYSINGDFLFKSKIGMMFALISEDKETYTILTVSSANGNKALFLKSKISKNIAHKDILTLNKKNMANIVNEVSATNYGWGGVYEQRDCSSMLRDLFAPFGVWLPRNSYQQSKVGRVISLENLSDKEKTALIKEKGVPFETLLYKKGHIVLYVGTYSGEIIVFHNTWGIKTKKEDTEGRVVIGKPIFSTLKLGKNQVNYDKESEILRNLKSMNILTQ